jgi:hypothetical protein
MRKLDALIAGSTGYIGIQLINLSLNIKTLILNIYVEINLLVKKFHFMINH